MISFALRLCVSGGREAITRLAMIAAAVAIGVGLLLSTFASMNAVDRSNQQQVWLDTGAARHDEQTSADPLWWWPHGDYYDGKLLTEVDVAATGAHSPVPPGLTHLPAPGEYYASPALAKLIRDTPADRLGDRFPGRLAGTIGDTALSSPDSLIAVIGRTPAQIKGAPRARAVTTIARTRPSLSSCSNECWDHAVRGDAMTLVLSVVAGALIFPVLIFIGTATRLSAATREQRYAAMRLVGATPRQVSVISAVESTLAAAAGTVVGFGLYAALRPLVATIPFNGHRFFPSDLTLSTPQALGVAVGVPVAAAIAARLALRRVAISPLGVTRRVTPRPPRAWRLIPMLAGLAELAYFIHRRPVTGNGQAAAYLPGFLVTMLGLVIAGPWLTMTVARAVARRTRRPAALIAVRRLADDPKAGFRAVSGLVLALFVTTATLSIIGTINHNRGNLDGDRQTRTVVEDGSPGEAPLAGTVPARLLAEVRAVPGVRGLAVVHANPGGLGEVPFPGDHSHPGIHPHPGDHPPIVPGLVSCSDLAQTPMVGHCTAGARVTAVDFSVFVRLTSQPSAQWPAAPISTAAVSRLPVQLVYVATDGSTASMERVRTLLTTAYPHHQASTVGDYGTDLQQELASWRQLANVVLLTTLPIAGCSLAVSVVSGLSDRRRPFAILRLTGAPLRLLQRVVGLESALPLLAVSAIAIGTSFAASAMFLTSQMRYDLVPPDAAYYALVAGGLAAALGIIASTLPLLRRITGPEAARNG